MHRYWVTKRTVFNSSVGLGVANSVIFLFLPRVFGIRMAISKGAFLFQSRKTNERMAGEFCNQAKNPRVIWNGMQVLFTKKDQTQTLAFRILTILL